MSTLKEILSRTLYGFAVKEDGRLQFWLWPTVGGPVKTRVEEIIPPEVVRRGADAVEAHARAIVKRVRTMEREYFDGRLRRIWSAHAELSAAYDGASLSGTLTHSRKNGALWTVTLLKPAQAAAEAGIYAPKYPAFVKKGEELVTPEGDPTAYALEEAQAMLVRMYRGYLHRTTHSAAYDVQAELERRFKS
jgi:hypothetical protein